MQLKTCAIISVDVENVFDRIQYKHIIKSFSKLEIESNFFNLIKDVYEKVTNIILHGKLFYEFRLSIKNKERMFALVTFFQLYTGGPSQFS